MALRFHHVGYACKSLELELSYFLPLGYKIDGVTFEDPIQKIKGCFIYLDSFRLELLEAMEIGSPINAYLNRGIKMYHTAYLSSDMASDSMELRQAGALEIVKPVNAIAFGGAKISFWMLRNHHLIELIEDI